MPYSHDALDVTAEMTALNAPSPNVVSASSAYTTYYAWYAFNHSTDGWWTTTASGTPWWIKYDFGSALYAVVKYTFTVSAAYATEGPKDFLFQGSNNDSDWTTLDTQTGITWSAEAETKTFTFSNTNAYRYYRVYITAVQSGDYCSCHEIEMFEAAGETSPYSRTVEESIGLGDTGEGLLSFAEGITDGFDTVDVLHGLLNGVGDLYSDTIEEGIDFASLSSLHFHLSVDDTFDVADTHIIGWPKAVAETIDFADEAVKGWVNVIEDLLFIYDETRTGWGVTAEDAIGLADAVSNILGILVSEWITLIDSQSNNWNGKENISDSITLYDVATGCKHYSDTVEEAVGLADVSSYALTVAVLEYLGFTDLAGAMMTAAASVSESIAMADSPSWAFPLAIDEALSVVDLSTVVTQFLNTISDSIDLADAASLINRIGATVSESIVFTETLTSHGHLYSAVYDTLAMNVMVELSGEIYECYVLNTPKFHPSMYSGFNFNSYCVFENRAFGANDTGIYELTGETDAGSTIHTGAIFSKTDFGSPNQKRFRRGYFGISGTAPAMILETDNGERQAYTIDTKGEAVASSELKSKSWVLSVADFETMDSIKLIPVILTK